MSLDIPSFLLLDWERYLSILDKDLDIALSSNTISINRVVKKTEIRSGTSETNDNPIILKSPGYPFVFLNLEEVSNITNCCLWKNLDKCVY